MNDKAGSRRQRGSDFSASRTPCAFCGGANIACTVEHCPPKAVFQGGIWPEGHDFPACKACNSGTRDDDTIVAVIARASGGSSLVLDGKLLGLMRRMNSRLPGLLDAMMPTSAQARRHNRELGVQPLPGQTQRDTGVLLFPARVFEAVQTFARKLAKGIFYREIGSPFPDNGCLLFQCSTNADLVRNGRYINFEALKDLPGVIPGMKRDKQELHDQFAMKLTVSDDQTTFVVQFTLGAVLTGVVFGCVNPGHFEQSLSDIREVAGHAGPLSVLQSGVLDDVFKQRAGARRVEATSPASASAQT